MNKQTYNISCNNVPYQVITINFIASRKIVTGDPSEMKNIHESISYHSYSEGPPEFEHNLDV